LGQPNEPKSTKRKVMTKNVWIDTDLSVGMTRHLRAGYCDVDDGYAVLQLMRANNVSIKGISAVFGNTLIDDAFSLCQFMNKEFAANQIPVFKGATSALSLANIETNDAVEALAVALRSEKLIIMAIGPATNIGIILLKYPELADQIEDVVLVAGRRKPTDHFAIGNQGNHARDLNFDLDNEAFRIMFEANIKVTLCPFEISNKVWLDEGDLEKINNGDPANKWLAEKSAPWLAQWKAQGAKGFNPFDVLASHYIMAPEDLIIEPLNARLEIHADDTVKDSSSAFKQYLICDKGAGYPINYCYGVVSDYHEKLIESLIR
jgi:pyrimidine-specific ribonucleoside hydrolase